MGINFASVIKIILLAAVFLLGCSKTIRQTGSAVYQIPVQKIYNDGEVYYTAMPADTADDCYHGLRVDVIRSFYRKRQERLFWYAQDQLLPAADSLINLINNARYWGLNTHRYHRSEIQKLKTEPLTGEHIARMESLLTDAYISIIHDISNGQTTIVTPRTDSLALLALEQAGINGDVMNQVTRLEPLYPGYHSLKEALKLLIDSLPQTEQQAVLLHSTDIPAQTNSVLQTLEVNLERWRSERITGTRYIFINIPAFMLYLVVDDSVIFESKVIVGTAKTPTPEISSKIECFVTYPYWHVPRKIAAEEYLPVIQKDISFIKRNNFDVLDKNGSIVNPDSVEWYKFSKNYFPVQLRQREGTENSLGIIKFVFDNPYAVFLHDTNAKRLFSSDVRAFSHGCIRLEKAVELSHYLVTDDLNKKSPKVARLLKEKTRHTVELYHPILIYTRYYTCDFRNNKFHVYKDIYTRDSRIASRLYGATSR